MSRSAYQSKVDAEFETLILRLGKHLGSLVRMFATDAECNTRIAAGFWAKRNPEAAAKAVEELAVFLADCVLLTKTGRRW